MGRIDLGNESSGICIEFIKSTKIIRFSGHYDHCVGIEGSAMSLSDFLEKIGITYKEIRPILNKLKNAASTK